MGKFYFLVACKKANCSHLEESSKDKQMLSKSPINYPFRNFELPQSMALVLLIDDFYVELLPHSIVSMVTPLKHCFFLGR